MPVLFLIAHTLVKNSCGVSGLLFDLTDEFLETVGDTFVTVLFPASIRELRLVAVTDSSSFFSFS